MGCDIHIVLERKNDAGRWVGIRDYAHFAGSLIGQDGLASYVIKHRNYVFFNDLCGMRGSGSTFGYEARGLPENVSALTEMALANDNDLHGHSWLTMKELQPVLDLHFPEVVSDQIADKLLGSSSSRKNTIQTLVDDDIEMGDDLIDDAYHSHERYRLVFAFDN